MKIYDYTQHGDFQIMYDSTLKRHYWLLGYASNITIQESYELAVKYAKKYNVDLNTIKIDEIANSRRYKYFKYVYSTDSQKSLANTDKSLSNKDAYVSTNVWALLTD